MNIQQIAKLVESETPFEKEFWVSFYRKPESLNELDPDVREDLECVKIRWEAPVSEETWRQMEVDLMKAESAADLQEVIYDHHDKGAGIIYNEENEDERVVVDMQGYDYIRYAGLPIGV